MHTDPVTGQMVADPGDSLAPGITPGQVASTETAGTSTSRGGLAPAAQERLNAGRAIDATAAVGMTDAVAKAGALAEERARIEQEKANREAAVTAEYNQRRLAAMDAADKDLQAARAAHKQAFDDYRKMGVGDFFSDKDPATGKETRNTGRMVLAAITVGLGGLMQRSNGGRNTALESLNKTMDDYFAREREKILKARDIASEAKGNIGDVAQNQVAALKALDIKEAAARSTVADEMKVRLSALGVPQAQIDTNRAVLEQQQKAAEKLQKVDDSERTHIVSTHTKALQQPGSGMVFGEGGKPLLDVGDKAKSVKINDVIAKSREMAASIKELAELDKQGFSMPLVGDVSQKREALRNSILIQAKEAANLGALSKEDGKIMADQIGGTLSDVTGGGRAARLGETLKLLERKTTAFLDSQGVAGANVSALLGLASPVTAASEGRPAAAAPRATAGSATAVAAPLKINPASKLDQRLLERARATKPGDPNYASAQKWLAAHGEQ